MNDKEKIEKAITDLRFLKDVAKEVENWYFANKLAEIINELKK